MEKERERTFLEVGIALGFFSEEDAKRAVDAQKVDRAIGGEKPVITYLFESQKITKEQISIVIGKIEETEAAAQQDKVLLACRILPLESLHRSVLICTPRRLIFKTYYQPGTVATWSFIVCILLSIFTAGAGALVFSGPWIFFFWKLGKQGDDLSKEYMRKGIFQGDLIADLDHEFLLQEGVSISHQTDLKMLAVNAETKASVTLGFYAKDSFSAFSTLYPGFTKK